MRRNHYLDYLSLTAAIIFVHFACVCVCVCLSVCLSVCVVYCVRLGLRASR
jgi:hypothetical protein